MYCPFCGGEKTNSCRPTYTGGPMWVQSIHSKTAEKWKCEEGFSSHTDYYWAIAKVQLGQPSFYYRLPKSEFGPCDPPDEWEDVTARCAVRPAVNCPQDGRQTILYHGPNGHWVDIFHPNEHYDFRVMHTKTLHQDIVYLTIEKKK